MEENRRSGEEARAWLAAFGSALEACDIPVLMPEEHTGGARSELVLAMQGVRLMVPASELWTARRGRWRSTSSCPPSRS